jgi:hypothetical protein
MITGNIIKLFRELIKKVGLNDWVINLCFIPEHSIVQFKGDYFDYVAEDVWALTYCLPTSKIAEIYILPNRENIKELLLHELLHIRYAKEVYQLISEVENNSSLTPNQARNEHLEIRKMEHEVINSFLPTYLK